MQSVRTCARVGSATGLKAGSQPIGVCSEVGCSVELCWTGWSIGPIGSRSPLEVRLTEMVTPAALSALTIVNAVMVPATKQLKRQAAAIFLSLLRNVQRMAVLRTGLRPLQKEIAFNINRPTNTAVSDRPKTSVITRSFIVDPCVSEFLFSQED